MKREKFAAEIIGYGFFGPDLLPIFKSEKESFKGKIYKSPKEALTFKGGKHEGYQH